MTLILAVGIGFLVAAGTYQLLGGGVFRIPFGIYVLLNATNLLVISMTAVNRRQAPLEQLDPPRADPLVQAMVLTAIIIGFGVSTFILMLTARLARQRDTLDTEAIREWKA